MKIVRAMPLLMIVILLGMQSCKDNAAPAPVVSAVRTDTLHAVSSFPVGVAIDPTLMRSRKPYSDIVTQDYNSITAENAMKLGWLHPSQDVYSFDDADYLISYAETNKKRVHGHTLIWHAYQDLNWIKNFPGDSAAWEQMMKSHIQTVATHFKGKVASWDVVNEAFQDDGSLRIDDPTPDNGSLDGSIWAKHLGKDFIARAFQYAHEADPNALLFYNDYAQEVSTAKLGAIVKMVNDFKKRGVPLHGVGLQMHIGINTPNAGITKALSDLAATGVMIHISELDINISGFAKNPSLTFTDEAKQLQKEKYKFIAQTYKESVPAAQRFGITVWNVGDADSWLRAFIQPNEWPLPFDVDYKPKPAYYGFLEGLKN